MAATILVVDDDHAMRAVSADLLADDGFTVRTAGHGLEAVALHRAAPADLIICDMVMPGLDGVGVIAALRDRDDATPVILLTAGRLPAGDRPRVVCLAKPFDLDELLAIVATLLGDRRQGVPRPH